MGLLLIYSVLPLPKFQRFLPWKASIFPMLRKHTLLQNITLASHVNTATTSPDATRLSDCRISVEIGPAESGISMESTTMKRAVPASEASTEMMKPGRERSMMYHNTGLTRTSVRIACNVDSQGSFR